LIPETTADAVENQTANEGDEAQVIDFYHSHVPHVTEWSLRRQESGQGKRSKRLRIGQTLAQKDYQEFRSLVKQWKGFDITPSKQVALACKCTFHEAIDDVPDPVDCISGALEYLSTFRKAVYKHPRLVGSKRKWSIESSGNVRRQRERREMERTLFEELSRYYRLEENDGKDGDVGEEGEQEEVWGRPALLQEGKLRLDHSLLPFTCIFLSDGRPEGSLPSPRTLE
jgi:hypothetical protein